MTQRVISPHSLPKKVSIAHLINHRIKGEYVMRPTADRETFEKLMIQNIDKTFDRADYKGARTDKDKEDPKFVDSHTFRKETNKTYRSHVKTFVNWAYEQYGVFQPRYFKPSYFEEFIREKVDACVHPDAYRMITGKEPPSVSSIRVYIHAVSKYQHALRYQSGLRARLINVDKCLGVLKGNGLERKLEDGRKGLKITPQQAKSVEEAMSQMKTKYGPEMGKVLEFQRETGARITSALDIRVKDINFDKGTVTFIKDKGNKTRTVQVLHPNYLEKLREMVDGKKAGRQVFEFRYQIGTTKGQLKPLESTRKEIEREYNKIAKKFGINTEKQSANTHSQRKVYAQTSYTTYATWSYSRLERELIRRVHLDKTGRTKKRVQALVKEMRKNGKKLSKEQLARLLASMDLGHNRLDVMKFYIRLLEE